MIYVAIMLVIALALGVAATENVSPARDGRG